MEDVARRISQITWIISKELSAFLLIIMRLGLSSLYTSEAVFETCDVSMGGLKGRG